MLERPTVQFPHSVKEFEGFSPKWNSGKVGSCADVLRFLASGFVRRCTAVPCNPIKHTRKEAAKLRSTYRHQTFVSERYRLDGDLDSVLMHTKRKKH
jgi:hypothetical protein